MDEDERAAYRAFVRTHHPDRGGDPEFFIAGLARFRSEAEGSASERTGPPDAPIEVVATPPLPARVAIALIRTWRRRYRPRVE